MSRPINEATKQKIIRIITALVPDARIYLFGSHARGTPRMGSDVDIALDTGKMMELADVDEVKELLNSSNMPYRFDVLDLHFISDDFRENIKKEGLLWKA